MSVLELLPPSAFDGAGGNGADGAPNGPFCSSSCRSCWRSFPPCCCCCCCCCCCVVGSFSTSSSRSIWDRLYCDPPVCIIGAGVATEPTLTPCCDCSTECRECSC